MQIASDRSTRGSMVLQNALDYACFQSLRDPEHVCPFKMSDYAHGCLPCELGR